ncbi:hypothetical protein TWF694_011014 [Orbilia ellipsospora]|uniref:PA14 domain-containing protein n=1 Tax=Orbilia ellipsospora TaxID=2528407 RepID=A0AAV9XAT2_9PEZI
MRFLQGFLQCALVGIVLGSTCGKTPTNCKSLPKSSSLSCSKWFSSKSVNIPTCTKTVILSTPTTIKYVKKGKTTSTHWETVRSTATKTVKTRCKTVTFSRTITKWVQKTKFATSTHLSTVHTSHTLWTTKTKTVTTIKTIYGNPLVLKRGDCSTPKACLCFATKTQLKTKTPKPKTKTISIPTVTVKETKKKTKTITKTKTLATADATKYATKTVKPTSTHSSETVKVIKVTSTSFFRSTRTKTITHTITTYQAQSVVTIVTTGPVAGTATEITGDTAIVHITQPVVHITKVATGVSNSISTILPKDNNDQILSDGSGTITIINFITRSTTSITKVGTKPGTRRDTPTAVTAPVTFIRWVLQSTVTITSVGESAHTTLIYPTDSNGDAFTTGYTVTVINYVTRRTITITKAASGTENSESTIEPASPGLPVTLIVFHTRSRTTVSEPATGSPSRATITPTGDDPLSPITIINFFTRRTITITKAATRNSESTIEPAVPGDPITLILFHTRSITTTNELATGSPSQSTITPTNDDPLSPITIIHFIRQPATTIFRVGSNQYATTAFPTDSEGHTVVDIIHTITVIHYITQTVTTINSLATATTDVDTTISPDPTDISGIITVIHYITPVFTTITTTGPVATTTTLFPTNSIGSKIPNRVITVIVIRRVSGYLTTVITTGPVAGTTTGSAPIGGTTTVIITQPVTTVTTAGTVVGTTTAFPTDAAGSRITDGSGTITVIIWQPTVTVTTLGPIGGTSTEFPTDIFGSTIAGEVTVVITRPTGSIAVATKLPEHTQILFTTGPQAGTLSKFPTDAAGFTLTDGSGTLTLVITRVLLTVTIPGPIAGTTTETPTDTSNSSIAGTITVYVTSPVPFQPTITLFTTGSVGGTVTQSPVNSLGSTITEGATVTLIITQPVRTLTRLASTTGLTTVYPTDSAGSTLMDGSDIIIIIKYTTEPTVTITTLGPSAGVTTIYPTDSGGNDLLNGTITVRITRVSVQPVTIITTGPTAGRTTSYPSDDDGQPITTGGYTIYITEPVITVTTSGPAPGTITEYPKNSAGSVIIDGSGTITIVVTTTVEEQSIDTSFSTPKTTVFTLGPTGGTTTVLPTDSVGSVITGSSGIITIVITQAVTTVTSLASTTGLTTVYPTGSGGTALPEGSGTISVITYITVETTMEPPTTSISPTSASSTTSISPTSSSSTTSIITTGVPSSVITTTITKVGISAYTTTLFPVDSSTSTVTTMGTVTVIDYVLQPITTVTEVGPSSFTTTRYPTDSDGSSITDISATITVIDFLPQSTVTITRVGTSALTTIFPASTDISGTISVIEYFTQPVTTIMHLGSIASTTTIFPLLTDVTGTITVIEYFTQELTTVTKINSQTGATTIYPSDSAGHTITEGSGIIKIITYVVEPTVTFTSIDTTEYTTTILPIDTNGLPITIGGDGPGGTVTVIAHETLPPVPDTTCQNAGLQVAIYDNPVEPSDIPAADWEQALEYFGNIVPFGTNSTDIIGLQNIGTGQNNTSLYPHGFWPHYDSRDSTGLGGVYTLNYRGYIYAPKTQEYTIKINSADDTVAIWIGSKAFSKWSSSNADLSDNKPAQFSTNLTMGSYTPFRMVFANNAGVGGYDVSIIGADGAFNITSKIPSPYLVSKSCDGKAQAYPSFGKEFPAPDITCENAGMEVALFQDPFLNTADGGTQCLTGYKPEYFKTAMVYNQTVINYLGMPYAQELAPHGMTSPYGCQYGLNYRGYFYAPFSGTYNFSIVLADEGVSVWTGAKAISGWNGTNIDEQVWYSTCSRWPYPVEAPSSLAVEIPAGSYHPIRFLFANGNPLPGASWSIDIIDQDGQVYVKAFLPSPFLVWKSCDSQVAPPYPYPFGEEDVSVTTVTQIGTGTSEYTSKVTDVPGSVTFIDFLPATTITTQYTGAQPSTSTFFPASTGMTRIITVINFIPIPPVTTTITSLGTAAKTVTVYPTDSSGVTVTAGSRTITVIDYYTTPLTTITLAGTSNYVTTFFPTNTVSGTATVISYLQPTVSTGPRFSCSQSAYSIGFGKLWSVDLANAKITSLISNVDNQSGLNAIGYNVLDDYLYALESSTGVLLRLHGDGSIAKVTTLPTYAQGNGGDIDGNGQHWIASTGASWAQVDLNPSSTTYAQVVAHGTTTSLGSYNIGDWVYIPSAGSFLWSVVISTVTGQPPALAKFSMITHTWTFATHWSSFTFAGCPSIFADNNGTIWFNSNTQGLLYRTNVFTMETPVLFARGVSNTQYCTDGARCPYWQYYEMSNGTSI